MKKHKTALITGAPGGLGLEFAKIHAMKEGRFTEMLPSAALAEAASDSYTRQLLDSVFSIRDMR